MPRIMYDSITPSAIPRDARMVAGYIDGLYAWTPAEWALFPDAVKVRVTALGKDHGTVLNLEPNGYWPSDLGVGWVRRARARGVDPSIYLNYRNHLALVQAAFQAAEEPLPHFWVAQYDGVAAIPPGAVAKQYAAPEGSGAAKTPGHYDVSIVADHWPGVDEGDEMSAADAYSGFASALKDMANGSAEDLAEALRTVLVHYRMPKAPADAISPDGSNATSIHDEIRWLAKNFADVLAAVKAPAPVVAEIDYDKLAAKVADLLAARLKD